MDFILMKMVAGFVESIPGMDWINLSNSLEMFSATIASQTRLDIEGWHLNLFNNNFKRWRDVGFPKPIVVTEAVLVETFEFGNLVSTYINVYTEQEKQQRDKDLNLNNKLFETVVEVETDLERAERAEAVRKHLDLAHFLVCRGEDLYLKMLIQDNLMHADLHPGNILIQNTHSYNVINSDKPQTLAQQVHETELRKYEGNNIILVDAGMVAKLTREEQKNFVGLLAALGEGDGLMAADFVLNFSVNNNHSEELRMKFRTSMQEFFDLKCRGYYTGVNLGEVLRGVLNLCRIHKITINSNYATLVMNALCLDGLVVALLPNYNILDAAKMFFRFHTKCLKYHCLPMSRFIIPLARIIKKRTDRKFLKEEAHKLLAETLENNQK
jgi:aarF domain-containing kinase